MGIHWTRRTRRTRRTWHRDRMARLVGRRLLPAVSDVAPARWAVCLDEHRWPEHRALAASKPSGDGWLRHPPVLARRPHPPSRLPSSLVMVMRDAWPDFVRNLTGESDTWVRPRHVVRAGPTPVLSARSNCSLCALHRFRGRRRARHVRDRSLGYFGSRAIPAVNPPSITSVVPVMKRDRVEQRKRTVEVSSSTSPKRPTGKNCLTTA